MFGKKHQLNSLETRKQLLVLESELNRAHLQQEIHDMRAEFHALAEKVRSVSTIARVASSLFSSFANGKPQNDQEQPNGRSRFGLGKLAGMAANIFSLFRSPKSE